jgi:hypothetical protein
MRTRTSLILAAGAFALAAAPAGAASVAYTEGGDVVVASPDGKQRLALTTDGNPDDPYYGVAQAGDGTTVAARRESFDKPRPVLVKFSAGDGAAVARNVMPAAALAQSLVAPIGMDIDTAGKTVAFGYSYCGLGGCIGRATGYWLTFADNGPANPSNPQGSSGLLSPSFAGDRIVSSDGYKIMVQEPMNAPFNDGHAGWIDPGSAGARFWAAEVQPGVKQIALEYSFQDKFGIAFASGDGTLGGATEMKCFLAAAGEAKAVSYSPDGSKIAWQDGEGVKVAGAPDFGQPNGAGDTCTLSSPPVLISATGVDPNFGGADVAAMAAARGAGGGGGGGGGAQSPGGGGGKPSIKLAVPARIKLAKRASVRVTVPGAGTVSARLSRGVRAVASGSARAAGAGEVVAVRLKLRKSVNSRKLRGKRLALRVSWTGATGGSAVATAKVRAR